MRLTQNIAFVFLLSCTFFACNKKIDYQRATSGLEYFYYEKSDTGAMGKPGDYYLLDMVGQREDDSVFVDSYKLGQNIKMVRTKPPFHSMFNDALGMLRIGDSVVFKLRADSFFRPIGQAVPKYLKSSEMLRFTIRVNDILGPQAHLLKMYEFEFDKMESYLKLKKWNYLTDTSTGIKFEIIKPGNKVLAKQGDEAEISYLMTYMDGKIINRTRPGDVLKFVVGSPEFMHGISRLVSLAGEGAKIQAILPFSEGFGEEGTAYVDPYATLIIEMDIVKIHKKTL